MNSRMRSLLEGAVAGLAATAPMTLLMAAAHRLLPRRQRYELPPAEITGAALRATGLLRGSELAGTAETLASHFAYGAAAGAVYRTLAPDAKTSIASGIAYGRGVWAGSYLVWLPASGLHRSAVAEPPARNLLMLAAHVVWGASLSAILQRLREREFAGRTNDAAQAKPADSYSIIRASDRAPSETVATGLSSDEARDWLGKKARETGQSVSADWIVNTARGESWQAVSAE